MTGGREVVGRVLLVLSLVWAAPAFGQNQSDVPPDGAFAIGRSVEGRPIEAVQLGSGRVRLALVGSIHGGWERNTQVLVARAQSYFSAHHDEIPAVISLYFLPTVNPDGLAAGTDRDAAWNANGVDLNRNFDTPNWVPDSFGRPGGRYGPSGTRQAAGGSAPFSEPETQALRDFVLGSHLNAVLSYHSGIVSVTTRDGGGDPAQPLAEQVSAITGYPYIAKWTEYELTGQFMDWLAGVGVKGIEIDLPNQTDLDWDRNLMAIQAVVRDLAQQDLDQGTDGNV